MKEPLFCAPGPCGSCPYRRDVPPGVWHPDEYEKLRGYDEGGLALGIFLCHQTNATGRETVCRGWLTVASDSIAVRLGLARGLLTTAMRDALVDVDLYPNGAEAAEAGMAGVDDPTPETRLMISRLIRKRAGTRSVS